MIQKIRPLQAARTDLVFRTALMARLVLEVHWDPLVLTNQYFQRHRTGHLAQMVPGVLEILVGLGSRENQPDLVVQDFQEVLVVQANREVRRNLVDRGNPEVRLYRPLR